MIFLWKKYPISSEELVSKIMQQPYDGYNFIIFKQNHHMSTVRDWYIWIEEGSES